MTARETNEKRFYENEATHLVVLWINNDEGLYNLFKNLDYDENAYKAGQQIREVFADELFPLEGSSLYADLINLCLQSVDWNQVYESIKE